MGANRTGAVRAALILLALALAVGCSFGQLVGCATFGLAGGQCFPDDEQPAPAE